MDTVARYKHLLGTIVREHEGFGTQDAIQPINLHFVVDDNHGEYLIIAVGESNQQGEFVHITLFHAWVQDEKIWVAFDTLSPSVVSELVERGVPEQDIRMAEEQPFVRKAPPMPVSHRA